MRATCLTHTVRLGLINNIWREKYKLWICSLGLRSSEIGGMLCDQGSQDANEF
jgi:hypothetical protein